MDDHIASLYYGEDMNVIANIEEETAAVEIEVSYPRQWFEANVSENETDGHGPILHKPTLTLPFSDKYNLGVIRQWVTSGILGKSLTVDMARAYIYLVMKGISCKLNMDWISFGRVIGKKNDHVKLSNLFHIEEDLTTGGLLDGKEDKNAKPTDDAWIMMYLTSIYRLISTQREDHREKIITNIDDMLKAMGAPTHASGSACYLNYKSWMMSTDYAALMGGIDMYFNMFNRHPYANIRVGTITTRFKDCASLVEMLYLSKSVAMKPNVIARWVWTNSIAMDLNRLSVSGNEFESYYSYMPYFMSLGLSKKSPYSAAVNPDFHLWVHIICCTLGSTRSTNAKMVGIPNIPGVMLTAQVFAYALRNLTEIGKKYWSPEERTEYLAYQKKLKESKSKQALELKAKNEKAKKDKENKGENAKEEKIDAEDIEIEDEIEGIQEPDKLGGDLWLEYIQANKNRLTTDMTMLCNGIWKNLKAVREGSIGELLLKVAIEAEEKEKKEKEAESDKKQK